MKHELTIEINAEGSSLAYMFPVENGEVSESGFRIAGPKAWGGSRRVGSVVVRDQDLIRYINEYAPHIKDLLKDE